MSIITVKVNYQQVLEEYNDGIYERVSIPKANVINTDKVKPSIKRIIDPRGNNRQVLQFDTGNSNRCMWHRGITKEGIGYPAKRYNNIQYTRGYFCSPECMLAYLLDNKEKQKLYQIPNLEEIINKVKTTYRCTEPAPCWELHEANGGPLSDNDWKNYTLRFPEHYCNDSNRIEDQYYAFARK